MKKNSALPSSRLRTTFSPDKIPYAYSTEIPLRTQNGLAHSHPQPRALKALELALNIDDKGYNIYLAGSVNLGRKLLLKDFLTPRAKKQPTPPDLVYVANFEDHDSPILIELPAGQGKKLKAQLSKTFARIRKEIPGRFEHDAFIQNRNILIDKFQEERKKLFKQMDQIAEEQGFNLDMDERGGLTLYPLIEGKRLSEEDFEKLDADLRDSLKIKGDQLLQDMSRLMRKLSRTEEAFSDGERELEREVINLVLNLFLTPVAEQFKKSCSNPELDKYFEDLRRNIIENQDSFLPKDILVLHDELDIPVGVAKMKIGGSTGGHNGLKDTQAKLGTPDFWRLRIGIDHPRNSGTPQQPVVDYVLKPPKQAERDAIDQAISKAQTIIADWVTGDVEKAMRLLHQK